MARKECQGASKAFGLSNGKGGMAAYRDGKDYSWSRWGLGE